MSSRHLSRTIAMQSLYEWDFKGKNKKDLKNVAEHNIKEFAPGLKDDAFIYDLVKGVVDNLEEIDKIIQKYAPQWPVEQITMIDRNILRLGVYELIFMKVLLRVLPSMRQSKLLKALAVKHQENL